MATRFSLWLSEVLEDTGVSNAELGRRMGRIMKTDALTRDVVGKLTKGQPKVPDAKTVKAIAQALGKPVEEAMEALGYDVTKSEFSHVSPELAQALNGIDWEVQGRIADMIPSLLSLAKSVAQVSTASVLTETEAVSSNVKEPAATSEMLSTRGERRETESAQQSDNTSAAEGVHKNVPVLPREVESVDQTIRRRRPPAR